MSLYLHLRINSCITTTQSAMNYSAIPVLLKFFIFSKLSPFSKNFTKLFLQQSFYIDCQQCLKSNTTRHRTTVIIKLPMQLRGQISRALQATIAQRNHRSYLIASFGLSQSGVFFDGNIACMETKCVLLFSWQDKILNAHNYDDENIIL